MIQKSLKYLNEKIVAITKRAHAFTGFGSCVNVEILISFKPELQLKYNESAIKSKLIDLNL